MVRNTKTTYGEFSGNAKVHDLLNSYRHGKVKKLDHLHKRVQEAMGVGFCRSKFYQFWKQWRLDEDAERRKKLGNDKKAEKEAESEDSDGEEKEDAIEPQTKNTSAYSSCYYEDVEYQQQQQTECAKKSIGECGYQQEEGSTDDPRQKGQDVECVVIELSDETDEEISDSELDLSDDSDEEISGSEVDLIVLD